MEITIPKESRDDTEQYFSDGKRNMLIKKGIPVKVPRSIAEIFYQSQEQKRSAEEFISKNVKEE